LIVTENWAKSQGYELKKRARSVFDVSSLVSLSHWQFDPQGAIFVARLPAKPGLPRSGLFPAISLDLARFSRVIFYRLQQREDFDLSDPEREYPSLAPNRLGKSGATAAE
jgi:hypothetical protein